MLYHSDYTLSTAKDSSIVLSGDAWIKAPRSAHDDVKVSATCRFVGRLQYSVLQRQASGVYLYGDAIDLTTETVDFVSKSLQTDISVGKMGRESLVRLQYTGTLPKKVQMDAVKEEERNCDAKATLPLPASFCMKDNKCKCYSSSINTWDKDTHKREGKLHHLIHAGKHLIHSLEASPEASIRYIVEIELSMAKPKSRLDKTISVYHQRLEIHVTIPNGTNNSKENDLNDSATLIGIPNDVKVPQCAELDVTGWHGISEGILGVMRQENASLSISPFVTLDGDNYFGLGFTGALLEARPISISIVLLRSIFTNSKLGRTRLEDKKDILRSQVQVRNEWTKPEAGIFVVDGQFRFFDVASDCQASGMYKSFQFGALEVKYRIEVTVQLHTSSGEKKRRFVTPWAGTMLASEKM